MLSVRAPLAAGIPRVLSQRQQSLGRSLERLSSGLRLNRAADDAAGKAVSTNLRSAWRSVQAAKRNVDEGLSAADTADGGLREISDLLQRMRELAVAAASETLDDDERAYLDEEFGELMVEADRTANTTRYGGLRLLSPGAVEIIVFIDSSDSMSGELPRIKTHLPTFRDNLQAAGIDVRLALVNVSRSQDLLDGSVVHSRFSDGQGFDDALDAFSLTGVGLMDPYTVLTDVTGVSPVEGASDPEGLRFGDDAGQKILLYISDTGREIALGPEDETSAAALLADAGIVVHTLVRTPAFGSSFDDLSADTGGLMQELDGLGNTLPTTLANIAADIESRARPVEGIEIQAGIHNTTSDRIEAGFGVDVTAVTLGIDQLDITSVTGARAALDALDGALDTVNAAFAKVGATRNRLASAARTQQDWSVALEQSRTVIEDADFAVETAAAARDRILVDAAISALAQAHGLERDAVALLLADA